MSGGGLPGHLKARLSGIVANAEKQIEASPQIRARITKPKPSRTKTQAEANRDLDGFIEEARAGLPDDELARRANVSVTAVLAWRRKHGIKRLRGYARRREEQVQALDAFGTGYAPQIHAVESSIAGRFEIPEYVLRRALNYTELCRHLYFLSTELGSSTELLALAFGLRRRDIELCIAVEAAHLSRVSRPCENCGKPIDPDYGTRCSLRCQ